MSTVDAEMGALLTLTSVDHEAPGGGDLQRFLEEAAATARSASGAREAFIAYLAEEGPQMARAAAPGGGPDLGDLLTGIWRRTRNAAAGATSAPFDLNGFFRDMEADVRAGALERGYSHPVLIPLTRNEEPLGLLGLMDPSPELPGPALASWIPEAVAVAIGNFCAFQQSQHHLARQSFVREVARIFAGGDGLAKKIQQFLDRLEVLRGLDASSLVLVDAESGSWRTVGAAHLAPAWEQEAGPQVREVIRRAAAVYRPELGEAGRALRSYLGIPLVRRETVIGVWNLLSREPNAFSRRDLELFESVAEQLALHVENAELLEQKLEEMRARVREEAASKAKSEFLALMSHELRTPLTAILGFTEVLLGSYMGPLEEKQREYLDDILQNGNHLLALINDVLDLAKVEAGKVELSLEEVDLPAVLAEVRASLAPLAQQRGLSLTVAAAEALPPLRGDRRRLVQILYNLTSNAIKFARRDGRVEVRVTASEHRVRFEVADDGVGISREDQEHLFQPFFQAARPPGQPPEGTGLGLSLTRNLVHLHGGRIWVESAPGSGSSFFVDLPRGAGRQTGGKVAE